MGYTLGDLMNKTPEQLRKECVRRGISTSTNKDDMVFDIIRHDAYFEGRNDQKRGISGNAFLYSLRDPIPYVEESKPKNNKREAYKIHSEYSGEDHFVKLTDEQVSLFRYLEDNCSLGDLDLTAMSECEFDEP